MSELHRQPVILLVDDDPDVLEITDQMLAQLGYTTIATCDPGDAAEILPRSSDRDRCASHRFLHGTDQWCRPGTAGCSFTSRAPDAVCFGRSSLRCAFPQQ